MDTFEDFFDGCPEMLFSADRDSALLLQNPSLAGFLGPFAGRGTRLSRCVHPDDRAAFDAGWARLVETGAKVTLEVRLKDSGGTYQRVACHAQGGRARGEVHGSLREIGEEGADDAVERERKLTILRMIEENLPITLWMIEEPGVYVYREGKALALLNQKPRDLVGLNVFTRPAGEDILGPIRRALAGETTHGFTTFGGAPWEVWYCAVHDEGGAGKKRMVGFSLDRTEANRVEGELREKLALIERQQAVIRALRTPIIEVWDKVLTLPMLGVIDSGRVALVMEDLLGAVSRKGARFAIVDLTGVEAMDASTASQLIKLVEGLRLLGAEGLITGIQPRVAQTMIGLGLDLGSWKTLSNLRDALRFCMRKGG